jgi:hypothetical protein
MTRLTFLGLGVAAVLFLAQVESFGFGIGGCIVALVSRTT